MKQKDLFPTAGELSPMSSNVAPEMTILKNNR